MATASLSFLSGAAPTWGVLLVTSVTSIVVAGLANGHKWFHAYTKRLEFRHKQAKDSAKLNDKLQQKKLKATQAPKGAGGSGGTKGGTTGGKSGSKGGGGRSGTAPGART